MASSTDNYSLGKGVVSFNQKINGIHQGYLDLGNCTDFTFSTDITKLDHYSSRGGLRAKDKSVISEIAPTIAFTLDEVNSDNLALLTLADKTTVVQKAALITGETHVAAKGKRIKLNKRGIYQSIMLDDLLLTSTDPTTPAAMGDVITGGTSGATAVVYSYTAGTDTYKVFNVTGTFQANEKLTVTDGVTGAAGTTNATGFFTAGTVATAQTFTVTGSVSGALVLGTDFSVSTALKDLITGSVYIEPDGKVVDGETLTFVYTCKQTTYSYLNAIQQTTLEGALRFVSNNPIGNDLEMTVWNVSLSPQGDTGLISDEIMTLGLSAEILKDSENHPDNPYYNIIMDEVQASSL